MGATNCPETPRQKMIGMMYLFYTALLALNVSNEVINAFVAVNTSMETTTKNFKEKSVGQYNNLKLAYEGQKEKYQATWETAMEIKKRSDELFKYVQDLKIEILKASEGKDKDIKGVTTEMKLDNLEAAPQVMVSDGGPKKGIVLKKMLDDHRAYLLSFVTDTSSVIYHNVYHALNTPAKESQEASERKTWEASLCEGMPMVGTITLLTKLQADIRNAEADMIAYLNAQVTALDIRISKLSALVNAASGYVVSGGTYTAKIFIGAQDTSMRPTVWVTSQPPYYDSVQENGIWKYKKKDGLTYDTLPLDEFGAGLYEKQVGVGDYNYGGLIEYESNIDVLWMPFKSNFKVGATSATVSPSKMMVVYLGLENPLKVSAAGYPLESINVVATGATIKKAGKPGEFILYNISPGVTKVKVSVTADGKSVGAGEEFTVKTVPPPVLRLGNMASGGKVTVDQIVNTEITANVDRSFVFENVGGYRVTSFQITIAVPGGVPQVMRVSGNKIANDPAAAAAVRTGVKKGSVFAFSSFSVMTPSGPMDNVPGISYTVY